MNAESIAGNWNVTDMRGNWLLEVVSWHTS